MSSTTTWSFRPKSMESKKRLIYPITKLITYLVFTHCVIHKANCASKFSASDFITQRGLKESSIKVQIVAQEELPILATNIEMNRNENPLDPNI